MTDRDEKGKFAKGYKSPAQFRTGGEQVEIARQGGIASGEARRERKHWKDVIEELLPLPMDIKLPGATIRKGDINEGILVGQIAAAVKGNTNAAKFIGTITGDFVEKSETTVKGNLNMKDEDPYADMPIESQERIAKVILEERHKHYKATHDAKKDTDDE